MRNHLLDTNKAGDKLDPKYLNTPGRYCDGAGLYVDVAAPGQGSYLFRYKAAYRSLGSANVYSIEEAREKAAKMWQAARHGNDPFALLDHDRTRPVGKTFAEAMAIYLKAKSPHWAASNRDRELRRYEFLFGQIPDFVKLPIKQIDQDAKNAALAHWDGQAKKRSDVGYYINAILAYAETGQLRVAAGSVAVEHFESMPYARVPAFYAGLPDTVDANALRFLILTAARPSEVIGGEAKAPATWSEITVVEGKPTWVVPANRMKAKKIHRVPLSSAAEALLGPRQADNVPLFKVSDRDGALRNALKAGGGNGFDVHGFRTTLQEWGLATTSYTADLLEMCIAHDKRGSVTRAYQRSDRLAERRPILVAWSEFLTTSAK